MKNRTFKQFGLAVLVTAIVFSFAACKNGTTPTSTSTPTPTPTFTSVAAIKAWLDAQPANTAATAYHVKLNVSSLGGSYITEGSVGNTLKDSGKFVSLDLSGSTLTSIDLDAFRSCTSLASVTIPSIRKTARFT